MYKPIRVRQDALDALKTAKPDWFLHGEAWAVNASICEVAGIPLPPLPNAGKSAGASRRMANVQTIRADLDRGEKTLSFVVVKGLAMSKCFSALTKREGEITKADKTEFEVRCLHNLFREGEPIETYKLLWEGKKAKKPTPTQIEAAKVDVEARAFEDIREQFEMLQDLENEA